MKPFIAIFQKLCSPSQTLPAPFLDSFQFSCESRQTESPSFSYCKVLTRESVKKPNRLALF